MSYEVENGSIVGVLPDGTVKSYASLNDYEDEFVDMMFELNNGFQIELPECV